MSKSIYEQAIDVIENIDRNLPYTWLVGRDNLMKIKQTLQQAQKQEKLLELYKTLSNLLHEGDYGSLIKTGEIQKTIEELEKELMKGDRK